MLCNSKIVLEEDLFYAAIICEVAIATTSPYLALNDPKFQMVVSKISLDLLENTIKKLLCFKAKQFWSHDFLSENQKRSYDNEMTTFVLLHLAFWLLALIATIMSLAPNNFFAKFIFNDNWSVYNKIAFRVCFFVFVACGYFVGNANECYCAYLVLHSYFQMRTLMAFMREALGEYKEMGFDKKLFNGAYQLVVEEVLRRSIQQYQTLKLLMENGETFILVLKFFFQVWK